MDASTRSRSSLAALGLLVPALAATTASAVPPPTVEYDALGDSYASGYGVPPYDACGRSQVAYAVQVAGRMRIDLDDLAACAGATTTSLVTGGQLEALEQGTDLVTISIGGNDIGWSTAVGACLLGADAGCTQTLGASPAEQQALNDGADLLNSVIAEAAGDHAFSFVDVTERFVGHGVTAAVVPARL